MSSGPYTNFQRALLLAVLSLAFSFAIWNVMRTIRSRREQPRVYAPFALAFLLLSAVLTGLLVLYDIPFVLRHPEWLPGLPAIGALVYAIAYQRDQTRAGVDSTARRPSGSVTPTEPSHAGSERLGGAALGPIPRFIGFYCGSHEIRINSGFSLRDAHARLLNSLGIQELRIKEGQAGSLTVGLAGRPRSNVFPVFKGRFVEAQGRSVLEGRIAIERGVLSVLSVFTGVLWLYLPYALMTRSGTNAELATSFVAMGVWALLVIFFYVVGKDDAEKIAHHLTQVLREDK